jgi:crotonobetainyl-CoA:carnitine CoA-transferase CaiB-like acyl-CoA transferase
LQASIPYPKQFVRSSENETATKSIAPLIGEHNAEIYGELGLSQERIAELKRTGVI